MHFVSPQGRGITVGRSVGPRSASHHTHHPDSWPAHWPPSTCDFVGRRFDARVPTVWGRRGDDDEPVRIIICVTSLFDLAFC